MTPKQIRELAELVTAALLSNWEGGTADRIRLYRGAYLVGGMERRAIADHVQATITRAVRAAKRKAARVVK